MSVTKTTLICCKKNTQYPVPIKRAVHMNYFTGKQLVSQTTMYLMAGSAWWSPASILKSDMGGLGPQTNNLHTY